MYVAVDVPRQLHHMRFACNMCITSTNLLIRCTRAASHHVRLCLSDDPFFLSLLLPGCQLPRKGPTPPAVYAHNSIA